MKNATSTVQPRIAPARQAIALAMSLVPVSAIASPGEWEWIVAPYGWFAGVSTDLNTRLPPPGGELSGDTDFGNVLDKLDGAFQVHAEGQGGHFGVFTDFTYLGLADSHDRPRFHTESDLDTRLFELAGVWNIQGEKFRGLEVFAGLRYINVDFTTGFFPTNPAFPPSLYKTSETYNDFMLGARYTWVLSERWGLTLRGDGSWGDTDGTWNVSAIGSYKMTHGAWYFGYRYLSVEVAPDDNHVDISTSGPLVGYGWRF